MRRIMMAAIAFVSVFGIFAQANESGMPGIRHGMGIFYPGKNFLNDEGFIDLLGDKALGDLTAADFKALRDRMEKAMREAIYVKRASGASFMVPGLGQFAVDEPLAGTAFLLGHLAVVGGALAGAYVLLPADLRLDSLDYLNTAKSTIKTKWTSHSVMDFLPSAGVMAAGAFIDFGLRVFSGTEAAKSAERKIADGSARLEVQTGPGFMGMRMRF